MTVALALNSSGYFTRSTILDAEYKERSSALAEACVDTALLRLASDSGYPGLETITVGSDTCRIGPITSVGGQLTIPTCATFPLQPNCPPSTANQSALTNLQVVVNDSDLTVVSWKECPTSTPC